MKHSKFKELPENLKPNTIMYNILEQGESYRRYAQSKSNAHYWLSVRNKNRHTWLGVLATLFSTIVGTVIFTTLSKTETTHVIPIFTGVFSGVAAVLSAFQTFFRFSEISQQHKIAATSYEAVRRKLDIFLLKYSDVTNMENRLNLLKEVEEISDQLNKIAETAPTIPDELWDVIKTKINLTPIIHKRNP